jgi:hypothetical protein
MYGGVFRNCSIETAMPTSGTQSESIATIVAFCRSEARIIGTLSPPQVEEFVSAEEVAWGDLIHSGAQGR